MKDAMETITAKVAALRVSKTSVKSWTLYGPVDQALKTSIQANSVKVYPLHICLHGQEMTLELWVCAEPSEDTDAVHNVAAMGMVAIQKQKDQGGTPNTEMIDTGEEMLSMATVASGNLVPIIGVAILTGAGCTDVPQVHPGCLFSALMGQEHD